MFVSLISSILQILQKRVGECHSPTLFLRARKLLPASRERAAANTCPRCPIALGALFYGRGNCSRLRGNASPPTHTPGAHCALGALFYGRGNCFRLRGNAPPPTHAPGAQSRLARAWQNLHWCKGGFVFYNALEG